MPLVDDQLERERVALERLVAKYELRLIDEKKCKLAPGVVGMWLMDDDRYEPVYSKEELNRRVRELFEQFPKTVEASKRAESELAFLVKHQPDLIRIHAEERVSSEMIPPLLPGLLFGGLSALVLFLVDASPAYGIAVGVLACIVQMRRAERRRRDTQARVNELRAKAGLPPEPRKRRRIRARPLKPLQASAQRLLRVRLAEHFGHGAFRSERPRRRAP